MTHIVANSYCKQTGSISNFVKLVSLMRNYIMFMKNVSKIKTHHRNEFNSPVVRVANRFFLITCCPFSLSLLL
jgi:hypothetical protein